MEGYARFARFAPPSILLNFNSRGVEREASGASRGSTPLRPGPELESEPERAESARFRALRALPPSANPTMRWGLHFTISPVRDSGRCL